MKTITLLILLAVAQAFAQDVTDGHAKKYNPATGTWVDAFPPGNAVQIGSIPVSDVPPTLGQILTFDGGSWVAKSPGATVTVGGDLSGTAAAATVVSIRGVAVGPFSPTAGQVLMYDDVSHSYLPQTVSTDPALYGDLAGNASTATVVALNGVAISGTPPQNNYVLQYNSTNEMWTPQALPSGNPTLGGDLSGTASSGTVIKLRGYALSTAVPTSGQVMKYDGSQWAPATQPTFNPTFVGDMTGAVSATVVGKIQGIAVSNAQPQDGQVMKYNASAGQWQAQTSSMPWSGITGKPTIPTVPTLVSAFTNDSGYLTSVPAQTWASVTGKPTIPTAVSQLTNDSAFLTSVPAQTWASVTGKPTAVSAWTNDSGYLTSASSLAWGKVTGAPAFITGLTWGGLTGTAPGVSTFSNDAGYLTTVAAQDWSTITGKPSSFAPSGHAGCHSGGAVFCSGVSDPISNLPAVSFGGDITFRTDLSYNIGTASSGRPSNVWAGTFTGSGAGLTSIPITGLAAGDYSAKITSGSYGISITGSAASATGNAGTVTNGVYTNAANVIQASVAANVPMSLKPFATTGTGHVLDLYNLSNSIVSYVDKNGLFNGSGAGLTSATVPIASLAAGDFSSKITSGTYSIATTGVAGSVLWANVTSHPTAVSAFTNDAGYVTSTNAIAAGTLNQQLVYNGTNWAGKDDVHEFGYVIQDTANDLTTTTGSVATVLTNAMPTGWTIQSVYCQSDSGSPTFNIAIAGTNLFSSAQTCTTTNTAFTTFASASVASAAAISHNMIAAATGNKKVSITIRYKQL